MPYFGEGRKSLLRKCGLVTAVLGVLLLISACGSQTAGDTEDLKAQAIAVEVATIAKGDISQYLSLSGPLTPDQEVYVVPKMPGTVSSINVKVGDSVREGQVLFTLDNTEYAAQLNQAQVALELAETARTDAEKNYQRMKVLYDEGAVSLSQLEQAELNWTSKDTTAYKAAVTAAQTAYDNTIIKSPMSGQIAELDIVVGSLAAQTSPAMRVVDINKVKLEVNISENYINKVSANQKVNVAISSAGTEPFQGEITTIAPAAGTVSKSFPLTITLNNGNGLLRPGMFGQVDILMERVENIVLVPKEAVINTLGLTRAYVINDNIASQRDVETGMEDDRYYQVISGLEEGDIVAIKGNDKLQEGSEVLIK